MVERLFLQSFDNVANARICTALYNGDFDVSFDDEVLEDDVISNGNPNISVIDQNKELYLYQNERNRIINKFKHNLSRDYEKQSLRNIDINDLNRGLKSRVNLARFECDSLRELVAKQEQYNACANLRSIQLKKELESKTDDNIINEINQDLDQLARSCLIDNQSIDEMSSQLFLHLADPTNRLPAICTAAADSLSGCSLSSGPMLLQSRLNQQQSSKASSSSDHTSIEQVQVVASSQAIVDLSHPSFAGQNPGLLATQLRFTALIDHFIERTLANWNRASSAVCKAIWNPGTRCISLVSPSLKPDLASSILISPDGQMSLVDCSPDVVGAGGSSSVALSLEHWLNLIRSNCCC